MDKKSKTNLIPVAFVLFFVFAVFGSYYLNCNYLFRSSVDYLDPNLVVCNLEKTNTLNYQMDSIVSMESSPSRDGLVLLDAHGNLHLLNGVKGVAHEYFALPSTKNPISWVSFIQDDIIATTTYHVINIWKIVKTPEIKMIGLHEIPIRSKMDAVAFSRDPNVFAYSHHSVDDAGHVVDICEVMGKNDYRIRKQIFLRCGKLSFAPNSSILAASTFVEGKITLLSINEEKNWSVSQEFVTKNIQSIKKMVFSTDNELLAVCGGSKVELWKYSPTSNEWEYFADLEKPYIASISDIDLLSNNAVGVGAMIYYDIPGITPVANLKNSVSIWRLTPPTNWQCTDTIIDTGPRMRFLSNERLVTTKDNKYIEIWQYK